MKKVFLAFAAAAAMMMAGCNSQKQETPAAAKADGEAVVYLTRDISPEGLVNIYKALGVEAKGRVSRSLGHCVPQCFQRTALPGREASTSRRWWRFVWRG